MQTKTKHTILRFLLCLCVLFALAFLFAERTGIPNFFDSVSAVDVEDAESTVVVQSKRNKPSTKIKAKTAFGDEEILTDVEKVIETLRTPITKTVNTYLSLLEKRLQCMGYSDAFVASLTEEEQAEARVFYEEGFVFYRQNWSNLKDLPYGTNGNTFGECGCGPTVVASVISNLAGVSYTPLDAREWAYENRGFIAETGATTYQFMFSLPEQYGITARYTASKDEVYRALRDGKLVLVCVGRGDFTYGAHFMLYRGVTEDGEILIADSYSFEKSMTPWSWERLESQVLMGYYIYEMK